MNLLDWFLLNNRLKLRFFSFFMSAGLIIIFLIGIFVYFYITTTMVTTYEKEAEKVVERYEARILSFIEEEKQRLQNYHNVLGATYPKQIIDIIDSDSRYFESIFLDKQGIVKYATDPVRIGYNYQGRDIYKQAVNTHEAIFDTRYHPFEQYLIIDIIIPVFDARDELSYIAVHQLNPSWIEGLLAQEHAYDDGDVIMFDKEGIIFLNISQMGDGDEQLNTHHISLFEYGISLDQIEGLNNQSDRSEVKSFTSNDQLITYKVLSHDLGVVVKQTSLTSIGEELQYIYRIIAVLVVIALVIYLGLGALLAKRTMKPIAYVTEQVKNRMVNKQELISVQENSELTILVDALNESWLENKVYQEQLIKEKQIAEDANKAKGQFLANMSHEIRTPMNGIIGLSYITINKNKDPLIQRNLQKIQQSATNLLSIINDILDYSKIEANKIEFENEAFSIDEVINSTVDLFEDQLAEKNIEISADVSKLLPSFVQGDRTRFHQILLNLVGNSAKFTDQGSISITANIHEKDSNKILVIFSVTDTGIGIVGAKHGELFKPFFQADGSTTRKYGGTGLGLTITKRLVENMGGQIWFDSEPGKGSTFYFTLPFSPHYDKTLLDSVVESRKLKVLIVDDDSGDREIIGEFLDALNCNYTAVASGEEAVEEINKLEKSGRKTFDLILLDYRMPGLDGFETALLLRESGLKNMPVIIMLTAYDSTELKAKAKELEFSGFLAKPIDQSSLFDSILNVFGKDGNLFTGSQHEDEIVIDDNLKKQVYLGGSSALLVEDNVINQEIAKEFLEEVGLKVVVAENGIEAINLIDKQNFDIIIMDVQMPEMDGHEATRRIRSMQEPEKSQIPIIALTAHAMKGDREKSIEAGADDYITKPFNPNDFIAKVAYWIQSPSASKLANDIEESVTFSISDLPDSLPGLDVQGAIQLVRGNIDLFVRLLRYFNEDIDRLTESVILSQQNSNLKQLKDSIHTIKGSAGNIGAKHTMELCRAIEAKLANNSTKNSNELIDSVQRIIKELLDEIFVVKQSINKLVTLTESTPVSAETTAETSETFYEILDNIKELLEKDYLVDEVIIQQLKNNAPNDSKVKDIISKVEHALEEFDYTRARVALADLSVDDGGEQT
ncbi:hybrid sensor histidine kinase/response regulator [Desulfuribacillus alkaliarsenatis]|uniref:Circadian input-output histidine kinase CikA n=1 Tax=Desulfuribacillus alkaliarsenatis TaxID=766136 RepID=A0A1E5G1X5_9FIRM|nr:hybrid sensor histidine kinase/response regulator [Desulfuribacillus alkaliarsenatis]OEF96529.1 hypothetical protein BHF68_07705 [Desulfuribacillus alkaliarsenatis]